MTLLHIYGPLYIHIYGLCIALGAISAYVLLLYDIKKTKAFDIAYLPSLLSSVIIGGIIGGRLLFALSNPQIFTNPLMLMHIWLGGFSVLGGIVGGLLTVSMWCWYCRLPISAVSDTIACYVPLVQSFGRIGCFFAGCCYGKSSSLFAIILPAQLISAVALGFIFLFLRIHYKKQIVFNGQNLYFYLCLASIERLMLDFLRGDAEFFSGRIFSITQWHAVLLFIGTQLTWYCIQALRKYEYI